ncbi:hypothetical protein JJL45_04930 [Tamlana sp. s12]|uniref:hypothetical protein n=1 Tax=Tamlana sp. s12 TaxID=1630406 RepID=UPI000801EF73|nr:hypothetical protein [Tamlana sp. s12]OBQ56149.1 hypothetical protein VQ01_07125 [Tamlana sp. s12]QQY83336.1 hypothetical protein JJL45_04930 [Tamlana sp. s12]
MTDQNNSKDELNIFLKIISFLMPIVGAILYFVHKSDSPNKSKAACHAALWGLGVGIVIQILVTVFGG